MKTICLNMIVKDESQVIRRCLASVKDIIDHWVIVDTGSTDGTQHIIQDFLKDIPGELHERPWVNFMHNRNEALDLARNKADYTLFIDADEKLIFYDVFDKNKLNLDFYLIVIRRTTVDAQRAFLINRDPDWRWQDIVHEYITISHPVWGDILTEVTIDCSPNDGHRSQDPKKTLKDAELIIKALEEDPQNGRYVFYLAQSYANARENSLALQYYQQRSNMGGCDEEVFWSLYCVAAIQQRLQNNFETVAVSYHRAIEKNPSRAEPYYQLANYFQTMECPLLGYLLAEFGIDHTSMPRRCQKIQQWIYHYGLLLKFAELAQLIDKKEESLSAYRQLLCKKELPIHLKQFIEEKLWTFGAIDRYSEAFKP